VITIFLRKLGHLFDVAEDGLLAVEAASHKSYDLILMDCDMPRMDGYEATLTIRRSAGPCRLTPIVALTANVSGADRDKCADIGMNDFLPKPITLRLLAAMLERFDSASRQEHSG
jgi:CheY-like chemotaxis protein